MRPGTKTLPVAEKHKRGTYQPCRDAGKVDIIGSDDPPAMPDRLSPGAQMIWTEDLGRVMSSGVNELDSALFANYCELQAAIREAWADPNGKPPPVGALVEVRKMAELLGIAGPKSRVQRLDNKAKGNRFAKL